MGFHLGGYAQIHLRGAFSLQPELYFSTQGAKWDDTDGYKTALSYLQIPVLAKYKHASGFFAETGPQLGVVVGATDTYEGEKENITEYIKKTDFSWALGAGYQITDKLGAYARYNLSLTKYYHEEKNSVLQLGVNYALFTTKK